MLPDEWTALRPPRPHRAREPRGHRLRRGSSSGGRPSGRRGSRSSSRPPPASSTVWRATTPLMSTSGCRAARRRPGPGPQVEARSPSRVTTPASWDWMGQIEVADIVRATSVTTERCFLDRSRSSAPRRRRTWHRARTAAASCSRDQPAERIEYNGGPAHRPVDRPAGLARRRPLGGARRSQPGQARRRAGAGFLARSRGGPPRLRDHDAPADLCGLRVAARARRRHAGRSCPASTTIRIRSASPGPT